MRLSSRMHVPCGSNWWGAVLSPHPSDCSQGPNIIWWPLDIQWHHLPIISQSLPSTWAARKWWWMETMPGGGSNNANWKTTVAAVCNYSAFLLTHRTCNIVEQFSCTYMWWPAPSTDGCHTAGQPNRHWSLQLWPISLKQSAEKIRLISKFTHCLTSFFATCN